MLTVRRVWVQYEDGLLRPGLFIFEQQRRSVVDSEAGHRHRTGRSADEIMGSTDAMKLRSSMTLFHRAAPDEPLFREVLVRHYGGVADSRTDALLGLVPG
jgi:uncharacterized protein (DUF1810 family)